MKIRNLYVGDIRVITDIKCVDNDPNITSTSQLLRRTFFYRVNKKKVKDVIHGGKYDVSAISDANGKIGYEYAANLYQCTSCDKLKDYQKSTISKKKLKELFEK